MHKAPTARSRKDSKQTSHQRLDKSKLAQPMPLKVNLGSGKEQILPANLEASPPSPGINHFYQEYCLQRFIIIILNK
jgi:hypothetical protein